MHVQLQTDLSMLPDDDTFRRRLTALRPDQHWISMGGGFELPMMRYVGVLPRETGPHFIPPISESNRFPRLTSVMVSDDFESSQNEATEVLQLAIHRQFRQATSDKWIRFAVGRRIEDYPDPVSALGRADLISDDLGPTAYSDKLSEVIRTYLQLLNSNGAAFLAGNNFERIRIVDRIGNQVPIERFFAAIRGATVTVPKNSDVAHMATSSGNLPSRRTIRLVRNEEPIVVPRLRILAVENGLPPHMTFVWDDP